jgi:hypothetical protein
MGRFTFEAQSVACEHQLTYAYEFRLTTPISDEDQPAL